MRNIAIVWMPHFNTGCFRAAVKDQKGSEWNYIIITCSPSYNGVWRWKADNKPTIIKNGNLSVYEVKIDDCEKIKELQEITNEFLIDEIIKEQKKFINRYREKDTSWLLKKK